MIGAIIGDVAGSRFEFNNYFGKDFMLLGVQDRMSRKFGRVYFTDDTVMTIAVADALVKIGARLPDNKELWPEWRWKFQTLLRATMCVWGEAYPNAGYGGRFYQWLFDGKQEPYNSCGNGSAMRVSPVIYWARSIDEVQALATWSAEISHNHPEGIKAAVVTATAGYMGRVGYTKMEIGKYLVQQYPVVLTRSGRQLRATPHSELSQVTAPLAYEGFLMGKSFTDCLKETISYGNDCDTTAAICGGIAEGFYGVPEHLRKGVMDLLPKEFCLVIRDYYRTLRQWGVDARVEPASKGTQYVVKMAADVLDEQKARVE